MIRRTGCTSATLGASDSVADPKLPRRRVGSIFIFRPGVEGDGRAGCGLVDDVDDPSNKPRLLGGIRRPPPITTQS